MQIRLLEKIERAGNKLPHPTLLFIYLCGLILLLSALLSALGIQAIHPLNGETVQAVNLLNRDGLHKILSHTVTNFTHFAPVGTVLVAIMGIGVAEHSGLLGTTLKATVLKAPPQSLTFVVVLASVLSSLAADTGYVVIIPLAAMVFLSVGRHPIAGIAAAFAGVSGGYSANLLIGPLDAILAGISTEAAGLVQPGYEVNAAGNYYFIIVSTLLIALIGTWVTEKIIVPRLGDYHGEQESFSAITAAEQKGLRAAGWFSLLFIGLLCWGLLPADGVLRDPASGDVLRSPFIKGIVTIIAVYAAIAGLIYGKVSGSFKHGRDFVEGMEKSMGTMATYLVLMFFAAQFVNYFGWSQLGIIAAVKGAELLQALQLSSVTLLVSFIILAAFINLLIGSASAKWALIAPIFVPMLLLNGISPEASQMAYRIGDSSTNIITPLMPYFGVVVAFVQQYDRKAGIGTIIATMLPYSISFMIAWTILLIIWMQFNWPLGPGAGIFMP
jgi:aminobenzoyl-glutamate transport protein